MEKSFKTLAIIPARGGSKGVPGKNIREIAGQPLIAYSIQAAQASKKVTSFFTSTDSPEIARIAKSFGSPVLMRPPELANDDTPIVDAVLHALREAEKKEKRIFDGVVLLQPTAPLRKGSDIDAVIGMLAEDPTFDTVISVCAVEDTHPARMYHLDKKGVLKSLWPEWETQARQSLPPVYHRNGALYAIRRKTLIETKSLIGAIKKAYVMNRLEAVNIDDEKDLMIADALIRFLKEKK